MSEDQWLLSNWRFQGNDLLVEHVRDRKTYMFLFNREGLQDHFSGNQSDAQLIALVKKNCSNFEAVLRKGGLPGIDLGNRLRRVDASLL